MLDLVLVFEAAGGGFGRTEGGDEDAGRGGEGAQLAGPGCCVGCDEVGQLGGWCAAGDGRCAAGDGVHAGYGGIGDEAVKDVGALCGLVWIFWMVRETYDHASGTD